MPPPRSVGGRENKGTSLGKEGLGLGGCPGRTGPWSPGLRGEEQLACPPTPGEVDNCREVRQGAGSSCPGLQLPQTFPWPTCSHCCPREMLALSHWLCLRCAHSQGRPLRDILKGWGPCPLALPEILSWGSRRHSCTRGGKPPPLCRAGWEGLAHGGERGILGASGHGSEKSKNLMELSGEGWSIWPGVCSQPAPRPCACGSWGITQGPKSGRQAGQVFSDGFSAPAPPPLQCPQTQRTVESWRAVISKTKNCPRDIG